MHEVLVVSPDDLRPALAKTVLGQSDVEYLLAPDDQAGWEAARARRPRLVIVALGDCGTAEGFVRRLRQDERTRNASLIVSLREVLPAEEASLRRAGASVVLAGRVEPFLWNEPLEKLLHVAARRQANIPVRFWVWYRFTHEEKPARGLALDISVRGMLLEVDEQAEVRSGTRVEVEFALPGSDKVLSAAGRVVREAGVLPGKRRFGIEFADPPDRLRDHIEDFVEGAARR